MDFKVLKNRKGNPALKQRTQDLYTAHLLMAKRERRVMKMKGREGARGLNLLNWSCGAASGRAVKQVPNLTNLTP